MSRVSDFIQGKEQYKWQKIHYRNVDNREEDKSPLRHKNLDYKRTAVIRDQATRKSRGAAFIQFVTIPDALKGERAMHGQKYNRRTITEVLRVERRVKERLGSEQSAELQKAAHDKEAVPES